MEKKYPAFIDEENKDLFDLTLEISKELGDTSEMFDCQAFDKAYSIARRSYEEDEWNTESFLLKACIAAIVADCLDWDVEHCNPENSINTNVLWIAEMFSGIEHGKVVENIRDSLGGDALVALANRGECKCDVCGVLASESPISSFLGSMAASYVWCQNCAKENGWCGMYEDGLTQFAYKGAPVFIASVSRIGDQFKAGGSLSEFMEAENWGKDE